MELKDYQIEIINRAMSLLLCNYDSDDLDTLMYSGLELESEIFLIQEKLETELNKLYQEVNNGRQVSKCRHWKDYSLS